MAKTQVSFDVPDDVYNHLEAQAIKSGETLEDYASALVTRHLKVLLKEAEAQHAL